MSSKDEFSNLEQDAPGPGDDLPTYDDLATQSGPNSRFGRWRGWIEKRAAERYQDLSPEERSRRRARGWGNEHDPEEPETPETPKGSREIPVTLNEPATQAISTLPLHLRIHTDLPSLPPPSYAPSPTPDEPLPILGQRLSPTQLRLNQFGSRFLPHTTSPIRCLLPLLNDRLLLIGHDDGLSVLDMFPQEWTETGGITSKGPEDAQARVMWEGEAVLQMSMLEIENTGEGTPQGVVLALVGPEAESSRDHEGLRTLRMYNLSSLISLAKWSIAQKGARPVALHRPAKWDAQLTPTKKHRSHGSIAKGLRSLIIENQVTQSEPHTSSYQSLIPSNTQSGRPSPARTNSSSPDGTWDVIEDLPLRWATDYVSLASAGSRLVNTPVNSYALWRDGNSQGRGGALLAVATKSNILLYEKPKGERAFRFVKEFYTPLQPRSITFTQQSVQDIVRSVSDVGKSSARPVSGYQSLASTDTLQNSRSVVGRTTVKYDSQLSIFVIFDKKAGIIRIADSSVGEVDFPIDIAASPENLHPRDSLSSSTGSRRSRLSDMSFFTKGSWSLPTRIELPAVTTSRQSTLSRAVYFLTRGKQTVILPSPLPASISTSAPIHSVRWDSQPSSVTPRICYTREESTPFLQLVALGEDGVEAQELSLSFLNRGKDKGKGRAEEPVRVIGDINGKAGFLCLGGHWHRPGYPSQLTRSISAGTNLSGTSFDSLETEEITAKMQQEEGIYGWGHNGLHDWRVFWVGGSGREDDGLSGL